MTGTIYVTKAAEIARRTGFPVVEQADWPTRSNSNKGFNSLKGITVHHTASGKGSDGVSDASYITFGSNTAPISNFYISRDGTIYVCAAGSCNHGGRGGPYLTPVGTIVQDRVNFEAISIEIANPGTGTEKYPTKQIESSAKLCAELMKEYKWTDANVVFAHKEWCGPGTTTPGRKIDPFGVWEDNNDWGAYQGRIDRFRSKVASYLTTYVPLPEDGMRNFVLHGNNAWVVFNGGKYWIPTNEAWSQCVKDFGYDPIPVDRVYMEKTGPVVGENPTNDIWGRV